MTKLKSFLFQNTSAGQTIAKNTFWLSTSHIFGRVIKAGLLIYAARVLGAEGYGVFSYALSIAVLFSIFADIGVNALLTRDISSSGKINKTFLATSLVIKLGLILTSSVAVIFVAPLFTRITDALILLPIVAVLIALDGIRDFILAINRGYQKMEVEAAIHVLTNIFITTAGLAALFMFTTSKTLLIAYAIGSGAGLLVALFILAKYLRGVWNDFDKSLVKKIIMDAWPFALLGLLGVVMINTDIIMLGFFRDAGEVGLYSAAQKPVQVLYVIPAIIAAAFLPAITGIVNKDDKRLKGILEKTISTALLVGLPLTFGGIVVGRKLMNLLFGGVYLDAVLSFQILLLTILIVFPSMIIANTVFAYDEQKKFIGFLLLGAIGNIILNLMLIPKYGINGSAVATIGAELTANTFIWMKMKRINHFVVLPHLKRIIPATLFMASSTVLMQFFGVPLAVNIIASAIIYFGLLKILKEPLLKTAKELISANS